MKYNNHAIRDVKKEFLNNSNEVLIEEISKLRKIINCLTFSVENSISDLQRKNSDGTIALDYLEKSLYSAASMENSKYFNITKQKENAKEATA